MGNSSSVAETNMGSAELLDTVLQKLETQSVDEVVTELQRYFLYHDAETLIILAKHIHQLAISNQDLCWKYVELAAELSILSYVVKEQHQQSIVTFREVFIKHAIEKFKDFQIRCGMMCVQKKKKNTTFFGQLFVKDVVSGFVINHWLLLLNNQPEVQRMILETIEPKVTSEYRNPQHDKSIGCLKEMLVERNISIDDKTEENNKRIDSDVLKNRTLTRPTDNQVAKKTMLESFEFFLENILEDPKPQFDLRLIRTMTDESTRSCARAMLKQALNHPRNIVAYANLVREIICNYSAKWKSSQKSFGDHLCELCEAEIVKLFLGKVSQWIRINNLGIFLGEIYIRQGLRNDVINKWLNSIMISVMENNVDAIKSELTFLEIIFPNMKQRDPKNYPIYLQHVKNLALENKIPAEFIQWSRAILGTSSTTAFKANASKAKPSSSTSPRQNAAEAKSSSSTSPRQNAAEAKPSSSSNQNAAEAKPSSSTSPSQIAAIDNSSSTLFIETSNETTQNFQKFLNCIEERHPVSFESKQLDSCSEETTRSCASILIRHASLHPQSAKIYAEFAKHRTPMFVHCLSERFDDEFDQNFITPDTEITNCELVNNSVKFFSELCNANVFELQFLIKWIDNIYKSVLAHNKSSIAPFLIVFITAGEKMKERNADAFSAFLKQVEGFFKFVRIPGKYIELLEEAVNFYDREKSLSPAPTSNGIENLQDPNKAIQNSFREFLSTIEQNPNPQFDFHQFETCSEEMRIKCAREVFKHVQTYPHNVAFYADIAMKMLRSVKVRSGKDSKTDLAAEKTLCTCFNEVGHGEIGRYLSKKSREQWTEINQLGVFFSELYLRDKYTMGLLKRWLKKMHLLVEENNGHAIKALLIALQIALNKMKQSNIKEYKIYFQQIEALDSEDKIPKEFLQWTNGVLNLEDQTVDTEPSSSSDTENDESTDRNLLEKIVNQMNFGNHAFIVSELVKLESMYFCEFLDSLIGILISKARQRVDLVACVSEVLMKLPSATNPPLNPDNYKISVQHLLFENYKEIRNQRASALQQHSHFIDFTKELHMRSLIESKTIKKILRFLGFVGVSDYDYEIFFPMLLRFIKVFKDELKEIKGQTKRRVEENLKQHLNDTSGKIREDVKEALQALCYNEFTAAPAINFEVETAIASKPSPIRQENAEQKISQLLLNLKELDTNELKKSAENLSIETLNEMEAVASKFYECAMQKKDFDAYAKLAQLIDNNFESKTFPHGASFKKSLIKLVQAAAQTFEPSNLANSTKQEEKDILKFAAELYKLGWIKRDQMIRLMDALSVNSFGSHHQIVLFNNLLQIISVTLINNGESDLCVGYYNILNQRSESLTAATDYLIELEVLDTLKNIIVLGKKSTKHDNTFASIFSDMNEDNLADMQEFPDIHTVSRENIQSETQRNDMLNSLWKSLMKKSELVSSYAKLCNDLCFTGISTDIQDGASFRDSLINFLQLRVSEFNCLSRDDDSKEANNHIAAGMLFVGELYSHGIVPDQELEKLLKPAKRLSVDSINKLTAIVAPRINSTGNVRSMAVLMNLEDLAQDRSKEFWKKIKEDIAEISEIVSDQHKLKRNRP